MDGDAVFVSDNDHLISLPRRLIRPLPAPRPLPPPSPPLPSPPPLSPLTVLTSHCLILNLHRVDSLLGLPDDLGRFLFTSALDADVFTTLDGLPLRLFAEGFGTTFARRVDLRGAVGKGVAGLVGAVEAVEEVWLDGCGLGGAPDVLAAVGGLKAVRRLSVRNNGLWDERVRAMTASWRFRGGAVEEVDVRDNKYLTHNCVRFFLDIPSLKRVIFSSTEELEAEFPLRECCRRRWKLHRSSDLPARQLGSSGWIVEVQRRWMDRGLLPDLPQHETLAAGRCLVLTRMETEVPSSQEDGKRRRMDVGVDDEEEAVLALYRT